MFVISRTSLNRGSLNRGSTVVTKGYGVPATTIDGQNVTTFKAER